MSGEWLLFQERTQQIAVSYHMTRLLGSVNRRTIRIWRELFDISYKNGEIYARKKEWKHSLENLNYDASLTEYMLDVHYSMKVSEVFYAKLSSFFILSPYWNAKKFLSLCYFIPWKKYDMNWKGRSISTMRLHTHYFIQQTHVLFRFFSNDFWILFFSLQFHAA